MASLSIVTSLIQNNTAIKVTDTSRWEEGERLAYGVVIIASNTTTETVTYVNMSDLMASEWVIPAAEIGEYVIGMLAIPKYESDGTYVLDDVVFNPLLNAYLQVEMKVWVAVPNTTPVGEGEPDPPKFIVIEPTNDLNMLAELLNNGGKTQNALSLETVPASTFLLTKSEAYTYVITPPVTYAATYSLDVFTLDAYINEQAAWLSESHTGSAPASFVVPGDQVYVAVISEGTALHYYSIYAFDSLRTVMQALLKKIFCTTHLPDCTLDRDLQQQQDRLFITKVSVALGTMLGMMHSEQVDHYHYFSWDESRLAALQRANDILQKTLLLFADYNYTLPCNCHST